MRAVSFKCRKCGKAILTTDEAKSYIERICIGCRRKQGLVSPESERLRKELQRLLEGKELSRNHRLGVLLEKAVSDALNELRIPHDHNPFDITYPCYQEDNPDIVIGKLSTIIECKNLNKKQIDHLTPKWLNDNVIERPKVSSYNNKIVVFSYRPRSLLVRHLQTRRWRVYSVGYQILNLEQGDNALLRLKQQLHWLSNRLRAREELTYYTS
jgi:hypothetical protein